MSVPGRKAGELGAPRNVASEEQFDLFCQPCSDDGQQEPVAGFCVDCCEYLCKECYKCHCRPRQTKHHVLQDKTTMPRSMPQTKTLDETINKCPQHQGEAITFNCRSHDQLVCGICATIDHRSCDNISYVEKEYEVLEKKLSDIEQQTDSNTRRTEQNVADIGTYCSDAVESIDKFRQEINHFLDKLEHEVINETNRIRDEDQVNMTSIAAKLDDMRNEIHSTTSNLDTLCKTKQNGKLFPAMDRTKLEMKTIVDGLTQIETDNKIRRYRFEPGKQIQDLMGNLTGVTTLGILSPINEPNDNNITQQTELKDSKTTLTLEQPNYIKVMQTDISNDSKVTQTEISNDSKATQTEIPNDRNVMQAEIPNDQKSSQTEKSIDRKSTETEISVPRTVTHNKDINVRSSNDQSDWCTTGSTLLHDNQLVIVDYLNKNVRLVDTKQNKIISAERMSSPWDITKVNNTQVVVTIPDMNKIQFLSVVSQSLSKGQEIKVNGECQGIVHNDGTLIVTFGGPPKVDIINMTGTVLRSLMNDAINKQLLVLPYYIAISPDKTAVYVSDYSKHTVACMAMDGTVKAVYKDDNLKNPLGLAIDRTGTVYVCVAKSHNIHQITAECTKIQILLGQEHGVSGPYSITYCDRKDKLYVGMYNNVKVYQLK